MPLHRWSVYLKKHLFLNQEGFYELPYLSNTPSLMVESIAGIPVSDHRTAEQAIYTDTAYTTGSMRYREIEEGLWLLGSSLDVKRNIISTAVYDQEIKSDYYFLSFAVFEYGFPLDTSNKEEATLVSTTCTFYKPNTEVTSFFYEGSRGRFFNIVFNKAWLQNNLHFEAPLQQEINEYLDGESGFLNWIDIVPDAVALSDELWNKLDIEHAGPANNIDLKWQLKQIITHFFEQAYADKRIKNHVALHNPDYANVAAAEKMILSNLAGSFIGVDTIARAVNVSSTKLKTIFKSVFGFSMLQYHKEKNMLLAMQLLQHSGMQVKKIASIAGYASSSKFAANFKKRFHVLPTSIRRDEPILAD